LRGAVDGGDPDPEAHIHAVLLVELAAAQPQPLALELARQVLLGQGRPVVRQVRLVAHQHDRPGMTLATQGVDGLHGRMTRPDDDDRLCHDALLIYGPMSALHPRPK